MHCFQNNGSTGVDPRCLWVGWSNTSVSWGKMAWEGKCWWWEKIWESGGGGAAAPSTPLGSPNGQHQLPLHDNIWTFLSCKCAIVNLLFCHIFHNCIIKTFAMTSRHLYQQYPPLFRYLKGKITGKIKTRFCEISLCCNQCKWFCEIPLCCNQYKWYNQWH